MFTNSEAVQTIRAWLDLISFSDFQDISYCTEDEEPVNTEKDYNCDVGNISKVSEDDDAIFYKDGVKYVGDIEDNKPHGDGQLTLNDGKILRQRTNRETEICIVHELNSCINLEVPLSEEILIEL